MLQYNIYFFINLFILQVNVNLKHDRVYYIVSTMYFIKTRF